MSRESILVIDDDESIRTLLRLVLTDEGYEVVTAVDGGAALDELRRPGCGTPSLILLDLNMPCVDGRAFLRAYRDLAGPHAPVILLTGTGDVGGAGDMGDGVGVVVSELPKPFDLDELLAVVGQHVGRGASAS